MEEKKYNPDQNYCNSATNFQAVPSFEQYHHDHPDTPLDKIDGKREETKYSCPDNYRMGSIQDNQIYIATTDSQHDQIKEGKHVDAHGGLSGYFSDQATVDACKTGEALDNSKYNGMCQIAPHREEGPSGTIDTYKPHVDCFEIDRAKLQDIYHTNDFNAAISKCEANNHFGSGGGNQGYNPYISEMIDNGTLKHVPEKSYSDPLISKSEQNNPNTLTNSVVPEARADKMYADAQTRAQDCVSNNTPHPSYEARNNGDPLNTNPIESNTGHATSVRNSNTETCGASKEDFPAMKSLKTAEPSAAGPQNPSQITPVENSTTLKNLSGNKDPKVNTENEAVSAATKAAGGMQNG